MRNSAALHFTKGPLSKFRYPFAYFGGKVSWLDFILPLLDESCRHFVDVFGGSGSVVFNVPQFKWRTYNDINKQLYHFFKTLREQPDELVRQIGLTPRSRHEFEISRDSELWENNLSDIEKARRTFISVSQSILSIMRGTASWSYSLATKEGGRKPSPNVMRDRVERVAREIAMVNLENKPWDDILQRYDDEGVLMYLDPPYLMEVRCGAKAYQYEMERDEHVKMLKMIHQAKSKVILSGYDNDLYDDILDGWHKSVSEPRVMRSTSSFLDEDTREDKKRIEVCWTNYKPVPKNQIGINF